MTENIIKVKQAISDLTIEIEKYETEIKGMDTGALLENLTGVLQGVSGLTQSVTGLISVFGVENETLNAFSEKMAEFVAITQGLAAVTEMLKEKRLSFD